MKPTAREVARRVLGRVDEGAYATLALSGELSRAGLSAADRSLATELTYGVLRHRARLDRALSACAPRGLDRLDRLVRDTLRVAAYQLLFLRVPAHAAVDEAVAAIKRQRGERLAGFANAVLRRLAREGEPPLPAGDLMERLSVTYSMPPPLVTDALARFPPEEAEQFLAALSQPAPLWLRLNYIEGRSGSRAQALAALAREIPAERLLPSLRLPEAVMIGPGEGDVGGLLYGRAYGEGWFTAQDLGAQFVARLLLSDVAEVKGAVLDACAGVGGKSTHLAMLTRDAVDIDAADLSARKLELCQDHARRLGCHRVRTVICDLTAADVPLRPQYGLVLLDAPCSGLGVLRRHPEARYRDVLSQVAPLAALQRRLLQALAGRVAPGGLLVYSVCTYTDEEGPRQLAAFLGEHPEFAIAPPRPDDPAFAGLIGADGALRIWPHRDQADAFFAVRLRRRG